MVLQVLIFFYVGEQDFEPAYIEGTATLKSYFDVNANVGFKYSDRLTAFLRANNITNNA
jgi:hypothetical protein